MHPVFVQRLFVQPVFVQSYLVRIGRNGLDENRLDENRLDEKALDENWVHGYNCVRYAKGALSPKKKPPFTVISLPNGTFLTVLNDAEKLCYVSAQL